MKRADVPLPLREDEANLVALWRGLPEGPLQRRVREIVLELIRFARDPHCDEMQGDGVPCGSAHGQCDDCAKVIEILRGFETRVRPVGSIAPAPVGSDVDIEAEAW